MSNILDLNYKTARSIYGKFIVKSPLDFLNCDNPDVYANDGGYTVRDIIRLSVSWATSLGYIASDGLPKDFAVLRSPVKDYHQLLCIRVDGREIDSGSLTLDNLRKILSNYGEQDLIRICRNYNTPPH